MNIGPHSLTIVLCESLASGATHLLHHTVEACLLAVASRTSGVRLQMSAPWCEGGQA